MIPNVWYQASLANRLAEEVLDPDLEEIVMTFNPNLGQPNCLPTDQWYYGLDNRGSARRPEMVTTILHELAHGLGFGPAPHDETYAKFRGRGEVYAQYLLDTTTGKNWNEMTDEERLVSAGNTRAVVWNGVNVRRAAPEVLQPGAPRLRVSGPNSIAGDYYVGTASFGAPLRPEGLIAEVAVALDEANAEGPSATDACSPLLNVAEMTGHIAVADRGTCSFVQKAKNVQAAGAVGLIVVNNVEGTFPIGLNGTDPAVTITAVHVTLATGSALKSALSTFQRVTANLLADPAARAGADLQGRPILFTPNPIQNGSTISHWDPLASPNQLMEPDIQDGLTHNVEPPYDLTLPLLKDLGWDSDFDGVPAGVDECPGSDRAPDAHGRKLQHPGRKHNRSQRMPPLRLFPALLRHGAGVRPVRFVRRLGHQVYVAIGSDRNQGVRPNSGVCGRHLAALKTAFHARPRCATDDPTAFAAANRDLCDVLVARASTD